MAITRSHRSPRWYGIPLRVALLTLIGTLLCLAFSLLFGIVALVIVSRIQGAHPDMALAYRRFGVPGACIGGLITLVLSLIAELRHYRQMKTLSAIERMH